MFKQCVVCLRKFSEERFSELEPYGLVRNFFQGSILEVRTCPCGVTIGIEHDQSPVRSRLLQTAAESDKIAIQSNKGGRRR
jgi:hypothetical protein